jgi:vitamin B12 transporter
VTKLTYALAALALFPSAAFAAEDEIVVTASGTAQPAREVGQAITIIDQSKLETLQTSVISDILRIIPSISVARNGGVGAATSVFIRGGDSSQTLVLIDGVRINDPSSPNAAFDFGALLTGNIGRVEVLRGPNSVIWGSQAIGGVVSIQTIEPTSKFGVSARAEYGFSNTAQAQGNISGTTGIVSGSVGGGYYRTDGISALAAGTEKDGYENVSANGKLKIALSDDISVNLRSYYNKGKVAFDDQFGATPDTFPISDNEQFIGYVGLHADLADGKFRNRLSYSRTDISRIGADSATPQTFNVNAIKATLDRFEYHGSYDVIQAATIVFGAEHERSFASTFFPAGGGTAPDEAATTVTSGFGQLILRPLGGLTLTSGVRYDDYSQYGGQTTFGANFAYTPNDGKTIIRGTYAEGFRAPTLTEALLPFGNTALFPETARSFDIGVQHSFLDGKATASATYFHRDSVNLITFSFVTFQSENIAKARSEGIELGLSLRPSETLSVEGSYSLVDAKSRSAGSFGNQLARRPKHNASLSADWKTPIGASVGATITLTGDAFDNLSNSRRLDGYALAAIRASYPITDAIDLFGRVENLFDEKYETVSRFGTLGRNAYIGVRAKF